MLRELIPNARLRPPAAEDFLEQVERQLGVPVPRVLRAMYLECDGLREPYGNSPYLLPLLHDDGAGSLVTTTLFYWTEWPAFFPALDLRPFLFFGMSGGDEHWGIRHDGSDRLIVYSRLMGSDVELVQGSIPMLYERDQLAYREADAG